jgi:hypothetical protein
MYTALAEGYRHNDNEVALVTRLVNAINAINNESYNNSIKLFCNKIHGSRSSVTFNFRGKPTTTELADMVLISIVAKEGKRILQRVTFVQNKVFKNTSCSIDQEQLFLLKNFPILSGNIGLFSGMSDIVFRNTSGVLGSYGLFEEPGEMIFLSAPLLIELSKGKKSVSKNDLCATENMYKSMRTSSFLPFCGCLDPQECFYMFEKYIRRIGFPIHVNPNPLFENTQFARDLYDLAINWTRIGIGEFTFLFDRIVNEPLHTFINGLLKKFVPEIGKLIDIQPNDNMSDDYPESEVAIMVYVIDATEL